MAHPNHTEGLVELLRDELRAAYLAGATDVHIYWRGETGVDKREPDFTEAASDYSADRIEYLEPLASQVDNTPQVTEAMVKHMANRFLGWKLPDDFFPDAGISFEPEFNAEYMAAQGRPPMRHTPTGTNLFDASQALAMVRYMVEGLPALSATTQHRTGEE